MIYNDIYSTVDSNMSNSNIGVRKNHNICEHLFVVIGIINNVVNNKNTNDVDIQIYDVAKCFDKLEFTNTAIYFYKAGVIDDKFITITNSNKHCEVSIKTPWGGKTPKIFLSDTEMQGTVLAGLKCSVSIDTLGKEALQNTHDIIYKYKKCTSIPPIGFVDDILAVSECSPDSIKSRATIKAKLSCKQLTLHENKCFIMHVGRKKNNCSNQDHEFLKPSSSERYLGDIISNDMKNYSNIHDRYSKVLNMLTRLWEYSMKYHLVSSTLSSYVMQNL